MAKTVGRSMTRKALQTFGCFTMENEEKVDCDEPMSSPIHLLVMVHGINGSAQNWRFTAKQFLKKYPRDVVIHCSECNSSSLTFDGVDVTGERLAEEVIQVINRHPGLQKISFVGHSFGGLVARYAIARLYKEELVSEVSQGNGESSCDASGDRCSVKKFEGKIAGLVPVNFITFATPHLGSRWHKQVPVFCGFEILEKVAAHSAQFLGRSVTHLFLADSKNGKPLLLQMVSDSEDLKFMSALQSFKRCVVYANSCFDHLVGWCTSSIRHPKELPELKNLSRDEKYPHIVNVEPPKTANPQQEIPLEGKLNQCKNIGMEEEMLKGLTKLSWERIDVNFSGSKQRFFAHSNIQVKNYFMNSAGADVVQQMIDRFLV